MLANQKCKEHSDSQKKSSTQDLSEKDQKKENDQDSKNFILKKDKLSIEKKDQKYAVLLLVIIIMSSCVILSLFLLKKFKSHLKNRELSMINFIIGTLFFTQFGVSKKKKKLGIYKLLYGLLSITWLVFFHFVVSRFFHFEKNMKNFSIFLAGFGVIFTFLSQISSLIQNCFSKKNGKKIKKKFSKKSFFILIQFILLALLLYLTDLFQNFFSIFDHSFFDITRTILYSIISLLAERSMQKLVSKLKISSSNLKLEIFLKLSFIDKVTSIAVLMSSKSFFSGISFILIKNILGKILTLLKSLSKIQLKNEEMKPESLSSISPNSKKSSSSSEDESSVSISENSLWKAAKLMSDSERSTPSEGSVRRKQEGLFQKKRASGRSMTFSKLISQNQEINAQMNQRLKDRNLESKLGIRFKNRNIFPSQKKNSLVEKNPLIKFRGSSQIYEKSPSSISLILNSNESPEDTKEDISKPFRRQKRSVSSFQFKSKYLKKDLEPIKEELEEYVDSKYIQFKRKTETSAMNCCLSSACKSFMELFDLEFKKPTVCLTYFLVDEVLTFNVQILAYILPFFKDDFELKFLKDKWEKISLAIFLISLLLTYFKILHYLVIFKRKFGSEFCDFGFMREKILGFLVWIFGVAFIVKYISAF